jgi:hypothetical protein
MFLTFPFIEQAVTLTEYRADFRSRVKTRYGDFSTTISSWGLLSAPRTPRCQP